MQRKTKQLNTTTSQDQGTDTRVVLEFPTKQNAWAHQEYLYKDEKLFLIE